MRPAILCHSSCRDSVNNNGARPSNPTLKKKKDKIRLIFFHNILASFKIKFGQRKIIKKKIYYSQLVTSLWLFCRVSFFFSFWEGVRQPHHYYYYYYCCYYNCPERARYARCPRETAPRMPEAALR